MQTVRKTCKCKASTVKLYASKMLPTSRKLTDVGNKIDNEMLNVLLLQGFTREYSPYENSHRKLKKLT
jgi:hypothetical protein